MVNANPRDEMTQICGERRGWRVTFDATSRLAYLEIESLARPTCALRPVLGSIAG